MKAQKSVFGKVVQVDDLYLFEDSAGVKFNIPEFNEEGTNLYKRVKSACNNPAKWGFKIRVRGRLSDGEIVYNRVPASTVEQKPEPVGNFNKPNGGLMSMLWEPTPKGVASKEMRSMV